MTLAEIKKELGYSTLELNQSQDAEGQKTDWFRHWDNNKRVAVSIHKDTLEKLKKNPNSTASLGLQSEMRQGAKGAYTAYRIVEYTTQPDETL